MGLRSASGVSRRIADLGGHDAYAVLEVPPDASADDIVQAYRRAMARAHPDLGGSPARAQLINCAFELLTRHRDAYDRSRRRDDLHDDLFDDGPDEDDDEEYDASGPIRVDPHAEDLDPDLPVHRGGRRFWYAAAALAMVVAGIVIGRQFGSPVEQVAASAPTPSAWTSHQLAAVPTASAAAGSAATGSAAAVSAAAAASPTGSPAITPVTTGHQCVIHPDTTLWCWGTGGRGQLGNGGASDSSQPVRVAGPVDRWAAVAVGAWSTCALRSDESLWCWGDDTYGQLGDGASGARSTPGSVEAGQTFLAVATGTHTCAVRTDHTLWCWGAGQHGELGDGTTSGRARPGQVGAESTWAAVTVSEGRTCAVRQNGTSECWGVPA